MSRLARAVEILEAINKHFQEGADCVYRDGLILSDDATLGDAVADCIGTEEEVKPTPHRSKRKVGENFYGNWVGFVGKQKLRDFGKDREAAFAWMNEHD